MNHYLDIVFWKKELYNSDIAFEGGEEKGKAED
jgi:hypothetical protein